MEELEWQEIQINFENNKKSEFGKVITGCASDNFDDFEEFTDFTNGSGLETFQETKSHKDDFDEFADFTESSDAFETSGNFQGKSSNNFEQKISIETKLPQVDLSAMDNQTLIESLSGVLDNVFRSSDSISSMNKTEKDSNDDIGLEAILGSLEIWQQISYETTENPFQWKRSKIRREFYASLGITIEMKEPAITVMSTPSTLSTQPLRSVSKSVTCSSVPISRSTTPSSNNSFSSHGNLSKTNNVSLHSEIPKQIDVELAKSLCSISEETLQTYTTAQLLSLKSQILSLTSQTSDILTYWLDQREQKMMDSETYNQMIERLVGHAQKLRDGGSNQGKSSWENRGKKFMKNNSVASGLASISLSFKNKKAQLSSPSSPKSASSEITKTTGNSIGMQERPLSM